MKSLTVIIIIAALFTLILAPVSLDVGSADGTLPRIMKLNVCHSGNTFIGSSTDFPCLLYDDVILFPLSEAWSIEISPRMYPDLLIVFKEEKPPRV